MQDRPTQPWWKRHLWQITPVQDLFWISLGISLLYCGYVLRGVFVPILIGFFAAYLVNPLLNWMEDRWQFKRAVLIAIAFALITLFLVVAGGLTIPRIVSEAERFAERAPRYVRTVAERMQQKVDDKWVDAAEDAAESLPGNAGELIQQALSHTGSVFGVVADMLGSILYVTTMAVMIPVYFCYFAWNYEGMLAGMRRHVPEAQRSSVVRIVGRMDHAVGEFVRGRIVVTAMMVVMFSVGYWLAGVPYALLLGTLTGLLSFIPYLAVLGCVLAVLVAWIDASTDNGGLNWMQTVGYPVIAYSVVQLVEGWLITPLVQSKSTRMHAVTIVIVLFIGGAVAGVYGLLLAIPLTACIRILWEELLEGRLEHWAEDAAHSTTDEIEISIPNE